MKTDASRIVIRVVLLKNSHPITYFSKKLTHIMRNLSTYARNLFIITKAVSIWRKYLVGNPFYHPIRLEEYPKN